ncbi:MAG TPA: hypothetical protein DF613_14270 [Lachnospiraceae bacterium]|nr:hypothetical protein [Lachnospiraceae bacterium]
MAQSGLFSVILAGMHSGRRWFDAADNIGGGRVGCERGDRAAAGNCRYCRMKGPCRFCIQSLYGFFAGKNEKPFAENDFRILHR